MRIDQQINTLLEKEHKITLEEVSGDWAAWLSMLEEGAADETQAAIMDLKRRVYDGKGIAGLERDGIHQANILNTMDMVVAELASGGVERAREILEHYYEQFPELIAWAAQMVGKSSSQTFRPPVRKSKEHKMGYRPPLRKQTIEGWRQYAGITGGFSWKDLKDYMEQEVKPGEFKTAEEIAIDFNVMGVEPYVTEEMVMIEAQRLQDEGYVTLAGNEIYLLPERWGGMPFSGSIEPKI